MKTIKVIKNYAEYKKGQTYKIIESDAIVLVLHGYAIYC